MKSRLFFLIPLVSVLVAGSCLKGQEAAKSLYKPFLATGNDKLPDYQVLFNGRIWQNLYSGVEGNQFLFSNQFLDGTITMRGRKFEGLKILYDIFRDEILIPYKPVGILQVNKEMVDSFSVFFKNKSYTFGRITRVTDEKSDNYLQILYNGRTRLYAMYMKKIEKLADRGSYDKFYQTTRVYVLRDGIFSSVTGMKDIISLFNEERQTIRNYVKKNKIKFIRDDPESYVPVIRFIDSLTD
jgi:hypothetical protein